MRTRGRALGLAVVVVSAAIACGEPTGGSFGDDGPYGYGYDTGYAWTGDTGDDDVVGDEAAPCDVPFVASRDEQSVWVRWQGELAHVDRDSAAIAAMQPTGPLQVLPLANGGVVVHDDDGLTVLGADGLPVATASGPWGQDQLSPSDTWLLQTPPPTDEGDLAAGEPLFTVFSLPDLVPRTFALDLDARPAAVAFGDDSTVFALVDAQLEYGGTFRRVYRFDLTSASDVPASVTELGAPVSDPFLLALFGLSDHWMAPDGTGRIAVPFVDPGAASTATNGLGVALLDADGTLRTLLPDLVGPVAWSADRTKVYGNTLSGSEWDVAAVDATTGAMVDRIDVASSAPAPFRLVDEPPSVILPRARFIADPPPEDCAWFCNSGHYEYDVTIVDLTTHESRTHTGAGPVDANVVHDGWFYWLANGHLRALGLPAGSPVSPGDLARRSHLDVAFDGVTLAACDELAFDVVAQGALLERIDPAPAEPPDTDTGL